MNPNTPRGTPPLQTRIANDSNGLAAAPWLSWFNQIGFLANTLPTISDVAAKMVPVGGGADATDYSPEAYQRFIYYQTDTHALYISRLSGTTWVWQFVTGTIVVSLLADLPAGLTPDDAGLIVYETEYYHAYMWDGAGWTFCPGDPGAGYMVPTNGTAPLGGVWAPCDGSSIDISQGDGTVVSTPTPNLETSGYGGGPVLIGGRATPGFQAATQPEWQAGAQTDNEASHIHGLSNTTVQSGAGVSVANLVNTGTGSPHSHNLSDLNAPLKTPNDANDATHGGGMPDRFYLTWYMRQ